MLDNSSLLFLSYISLLCSFSVGMTINQPLLFKWNTQEYTLRFHSFITASVLVYLASQYPLVGYSSIAYSFWPFG